MIDAKIREREERLTMLLFHLFHNVFCPDRGIPGAGKDEGKGDVLPAIFFIWFEAVAENMDHVAVCEAAGVPYETWEHLREMSSSGLAPERVFAAWPNIILGDRPPPAHKIKTLTNTVLVTYEDGTIFPLQYTVHADAMNGHGLSDSTVAMIITSRFRATVKEVVDSGVDGMHAQGANYGGDEVFNVLMGAFLKIIPQLKPELHENLKNYMRLCQGIIQPPNPADHRPRVATGPPAPRGPQKGGWDA